MLELRDIEMFCARLVLILIEHELTLKKEAVRG